MSFRDLRPLLLRLGQSSWVRNLWWLGLVLGLGLGFLLSQRYVMPMQLEQSGQRHLRWLLSPELKSIRVGDTLIDHSSRPLRVLETAKIKQGQKLSLDSMSLEEALLRLPLFAQQPAVQLELKWLVGQKSQGLVQIGAIGLLQKRALSIDSLQKWNRSLDSVADLGLEPVISIHFVQSKKILSNYVSPVAWEYCQVLDAGRSQVLIPRDSILGVFWK